MKDAVRSVSSDVLLDTPTWGVFYPYDGIVQPCSTREDAEQDIAEARESADDYLHGATLVRIHIEEVTS